MKVLLCIGSLVLGFILFVWVNQQNFTSPKDSIVMAQQWIINMQRVDSGLFHYQYNVDKNEFSSENNLVRQVGTFWSLVASQKINNTPEVQASIDRFRKSILKLQKTSTKNKSIHLVLEGQPAKINTTALYIIALSVIVEQGGTLSEEENILIRRLVQEIHYQQAPSGGFYYLYDLAPKNNRVSIYGSSQWLYALTKYYKIFPKEEKVAALVENNFKLLYKKAINAPLEKEEARAFILWALYTLGAAENIWTFEKRKQMTWVLLEKILNYRDQVKGCRNSGCIFGENRSDPALLEGIIASQKIFNFQDKKLLEYIKKSVNLIQLQQLISKNPYINGGFCFVSPCKLLQIDHTQHHLMSLIQNIIR